MLTDEELLDSLRRKYGKENVGEIVEIKDGRRFIRIKGIPAPYETIYDEMVGPGEYKRAIAEKDE